MSKIVGAVALAAAQTTSMNDDGMPPIEYRGPTMAVVITVNTQTELETYCGKAPDGYVRLGCSGQVKGVPTTVLPNPCLLGDQEMYARLVCHELGHLQGWPGNHPRNVAQ